MVLVMARQEAEPRESWPKTVWGELKKNSRNPRDLVENWESYSLKWFNLLFLSVRRKEMKLLTMKMMG
jgi:hypothetical protein